ncbi:HD domain-containing protein [Thermoleptolyngbya sichuanensis A183]|uniref:HD domain-containing protein n=1 Tax=Thermoleptolyngbya sichuanensis A183 TaxID=2737172 RepID=A0A6M8BP53_9CYAN|nr:HD domain-containing protein [Thermoleptolyngbya sichuanensis]QKD84085.1 HD domain-containing protein [Thermoleptolyngbya sichuanensis A183]
MQNWRCNLFSEFDLAPTRLAQQIQFVLEIDKLKGVLRQTLLTDASRRENSAEHSWHLALMAIALAEYAPASIDLSRVVQMLLLHDLVEIDAGNTFAFDIQANQDKAEREQAAADRLFGLLPPDLGQPLRACWEEFEAAETVDAQFAHALDRFQPFLHNLQTEGGTWRLHGITCDRVLGRMQPVKQGAPALWPIVEALIHQAVAAGYLLPDPDTTPPSDRSYPDRLHPD